MSIFQQLLGIQPQQVGGVMGAVIQSQPQSGFAPQQQPSQQKPKFWQTPEFATSLSRLGANLMQSSTQNESLLDALSLAGSQTVNQGLEQQAAMRQEQAQQEQQAQTGPFGGNGYQNQIMSSRYQFHIANGESPLVAQQKAINDFYSLNPVTGVDAEGRPYTTQRSSLSYEIGAQPIAQPVAQTMPQGDAISETAASLGLPAGTLLPPRSNQQPQVAVPTQGMLPPPSFNGPSMQKSDAISVPQIGGPKTQQALTQAAGEAQIAVEKEGLMGAAKSTQEKQADFKTQAAQLPMLAEVVGKLNNLADKASFTLGQRGTDFLYTQGLGIPTTGDTARTEYISTVRNVVLPLLRSTFGAQFTAKEGETLLETLGSPNASPEAKKATLNAFVEQKVRNLQTSAKEAGVDISQGIIPASTNRIQTKQEFDALPKGSKFIAPDGSERIKP